MSIPKDASSEESLQGSWVEFHFTQSISRHGSQELVMPTSTQQDDVENMLLDAQHESSRSSSGGSSECNSPCRALTPLVWRGSGGSSLQSDEDLQERRQEVEMMMKKNADWIWDWSSRPENNPPKSFHSLFCHMKSRGASCLIYDNLVIEAREFLLKHPKRATALSMRNSSVMKKGGVLSPDFLQLFLPSLIISHILAIGLGIYVGKRLASHSTL